MARTSYFTGFPLNQNQSVYVEDVIRQLGDLYTDTEEILNTTIDARDQAQAAALSATASENVATTAKDDALVAKQEAQDAAYDAEQERLQAQQAAADAEGSSQAAASSAADAEDVLDQVTNLYGDATEIHDAVTTAVDAKDEAVQARDATIYALENAEEIYGDTAALQLAVTQAENARDASQDAKTLAEKWASEAEDVPVVPGHFSAKHWAAKASEELGQSALKNQNLADLTDLKEARSNLGEFATVADVESANIPPVLESITVSGTRYEREGSEPSHNSKVQSADGSWWTPVVPFGYAFDSVSDMQASRLVTPGVRVRTLGYYTPGDGGGNDYEIVAAGTGTDDGGSFIDLSGSGLQARGLHGKVLNVKQYGAAGGYNIEAQTGVDDTAAFNRVWEITQESTQSILAPSGATVGGYSVLTYLQEYSIVIPRDTYYVDNVNWRDNFRNRNIFIYGNGSTVCGRTPNGAIINTGDSRWIHCKDLVIYGLPPLNNVDDPAQESYCGLYMGKYRRNSVGNNVWENLSVIGHFSRAGVYNMASETTTFFRPRITNWSRDPNAFAYVSDGFNYWDVPDELCDSSIFPSGTGLSNTNNEIIAGDFRNLGGHDSIFLAKTSGHTFSRGTYYLAFGGASVRLHTSDEFSHEDLTLLGHAETSASSPLAGANNSYYYETPVTGLKYFINFVGDGTDSEINGLVVKGHAHQANSSVFNNESAGSITIKRFEFETNSLVYAPRIFQGMSNAKVFGSIKFDDSSKINLNNVLQFSGTVHSEGIPSGMRGFHINQSDGLSSLTRTRFVGLDESKEATVEAGVVNVGSSFIFIQGAGQTITEFTKPAGLSGQVFFILRNSSGSGSITIEHSTPSIRTKDGSDYVIPPLGSATFVFINNTTVQQIA